MADKIKDYVPVFVSEYKITGSREGKEGEDQPGVRGRREGAGLSGGVLHQRKTVHILSQVRVGLYIRESDTSRWVHRVPTRTGKPGKPGKMGRHFPVREKSGNFEQTGKVRENHTKYWKTQGI